MHLLKNSGPSYHKLFYLHFFNEKKENHMTKYRKNVIFSKMHFGTGLFFENIGYW
jgi:hypothetical protein